MADTPVFADTATAARLNAALKAQQQSQPASQPQAGTAFADPETAARLNIQAGVQQPQAGLWDDLASAGTGLARGAIELPGVAGDIADLAELGYGKLAGDKAIQQHAIDGLHGKNGFDMSTASIANFLNQHGLLTHQPHSEAAQRIQNVANFIGGMLGGGIGGIAKAGAKEGIEAAAKVAAKDAAVGTAAGVGNEAGRELSDNYIDPTSPLAPYDRMALELGGSLLGGGLGGGALNRSLLYEASPLAQDFKAAGVNPRFSQDVNPNTSLWRNPVATATSKGLPGRFGAETASKRAAQATQNELSGYAQKVLQPGNVSLQAQGEGLQSGAQASVDALRQETTDAFDNVNKIIDPNTPVTTRNTKAAVGNLVNQATDPAVKAIVSTPQFQRFAPLLSKDALSWSDMNVLRQEVGSSLQSADGSELGLLKSLYRGILDDMRSTASQDPTWLEAYNKAASVASENNDKINGILKNVINNSNPESLPQWLMQKSKQGSTRLDDLFGTPGFQNGSSVSQATVGQNLLGNAGLNNGQFDLGKLMNYWKSASPEAKNALTLDPTVAEGMARLSRLWDATAKSRALAQQQPNLRDLGHTILEGMGTEGSGLALGAFGHPVAGAVAGGVPLAMWGASKVAQTPSLVSRLATPLEGGMVGPMTKYGLSGLAGTNSTMPDVYVPQPAPPQTEEPSPEWLGSLDKPSAVAYVQSKLGPQAAAQLQATDNAGYKAALFQLTSNPATRKALFPSAGFDWNLNDHIAGAGVSPFYPNHDVQ